MNEDLIKCWKCHICGRTINSVKYVWSEAMCGCRRVKIIDYTPVMKQTGEW